MNADDLWQLANLIWPEKRWADTSAEKCLVEVALRVAAEAQRLDAAREKDKPNMSTNDGSFTDANGRKVRVGDHVQYRDGRNGRMVAIFQDGSGYVRFDGDPGDTDVNWKHIAKWPDQPTPAPAQQEDVLGEIAAEAGFYGPALPADFGKQADTDANAEKLARSCEFQEERDAAHNDDILAKDAEIARLNAEIAELNKQAVLSACGFNARLTAAESSLRVMSERAGDVGHGRLCSFCNEPINSYTGNATKWGLYFTDPDQLGTGKGRWHHEGCVVEKLAALDSTRPAEGSKAHE